LSHLKLSIGMIVKNESAHLRNCLIALHPLMDAVESELIIADTGSTDDTIQIAKDFTNNVMEIPWNNDFAEARNHTLKAAKGEWFMAIDADEYLEDATEFIKFFKEGIYKRCDGASYYQRNYSDEVTYQQCLVFRLCKITPDIKYSGYVHECLPPVKVGFVINAHVRHHGHVSDTDPELIKKKTLRNYPMLLKRLADNPNDLTAIRSLFYTCWTLNEPDNAKRYLDMGLAIAQKNVNHPSFVSFYIMYAVHYSKIDTPEAHRKVITIVDEFHKIKQKPSIGSIDLMCTKAASHFDLKEYHAAALSYIATHDLIQLYYKGELDASEITTLLAPMANESTDNIIMGNIISCYITINDYDNALVWLFKKPLQRIKEFTRFNEVITLSGKLELYEHLLKHILKLSDINTKLMDKFINAFDKTIRNYSFIVKLIQPFFELYQKTIYGFLIRNGLKYDEIKSLPSVHQVVYYAQMADLAQHDTTVAVQHIKTAMRADSRFVPILSAKLRSKG